MISVKNLYLSYSKDYNALHNINIEISDGEKVCLLGDIESGKTSLIRAICGLEEYYKGEIYFDNKNIKKIVLGKQFDVVYISNKGIFIENKTVYDNLKYVLKIRHTDQVKIEKSIEDSLEKFNLHKLKNSKLKDLSQFERVLLQLCRANLRKVDYYFIDDICKDLSEEQCHIITEHLKDWQKSDATFLIATDNKLIANILSTRIIKIHLGSII